MYSALKEHSDMTDNKTIAGIIYLKDSKAVYSEHDDTVLYDDPVKYAEALSDAGFDEIIIFDLSKAGDDKAHDAAIDTIRNISKISDSIIVGAGNIKRMEDVKKLLYAGCKKAIVDLRSNKNADILEEVSAKFGKDKILVSYSKRSEISGNRELIHEYASELVFIEEDESEFKDTGNDNKTLYIPSVQNALFSDASFGDEDVNNSNDKLYTYLVDFFKEVDFADGYGVTFGKKALGHLGLDENDTAVTSPLNILLVKSDLFSAGINTNILNASFAWADLKLNNDGMVPVIVQDYRTDQVLMLAYMNEEAYNTTLRTGKMTYFSRSRNELWIKGETSSHFQYVRSLTADCDLDTILAKVKQVGAACHTGSYSCFFNEIAKKEYDEKNPQKVLDSVFDVIKDRKVNPREGSYTNYLFDKGIDKILKKVGEEATEMVIAAKNPNENEVIYEMSDFLYHMMVLMAEKNVSWEDITDELARR